MPICLHAMAGYALGGRVEEAELSTCYRDCMAYKHKIFTIWLLAKKGKKTSALKP